MAGIGRGLSILSDFGEFLAELLWNVDVVILVFVIF